MALVGPQHYRVRLLTHIARAVAIPQIILYLAFKALELHVSRAAYIALSILSVPFAIWVNSIYTQHNNRREAARLGAEEIPRVKGRWIGNLDIVLRLSKSLREDYMNQYIADLHEEYGAKTLNLGLLGTDFIVTIDDNVVKYILTGQSFEWFGKGETARERTWSLFGRGIFAADGKEWQAHRNTARPWFNKDRISDYDIFERHSTTTMSIIRSHAKQCAPLDFQDLIGRFTLDAASEFLFGQCTNTLEKPLPPAFSAQLGPKGSALPVDEFGSFSWAFEDIQVSISKRLRVGVAWPIIEFFHDRTLNSGKVIYRWLTPIVQRALKEKQSAKVAGGRTEEEKTFLGHLADSTDNIDLIRDQVMNMLLAGRDTTAATLSFCIYFMAMYPEKLARLREEVLSHYGTDQRPTYDNIRNLKYLRAVINETLRLFPAVPTNARSKLPGAARAFPASQDTPSYYVPNGAQVLYNSYLIQRRKDLWGDDADEFEPLRWIDPERIKVVTKRPFMFVPFHAGPRICLGQQFALNEMSFFLVKLLQNFKSVELALDAQVPGSVPPDQWKTGAGRQAIEKIWPSSSVTSFIKGGLWVRFVPAQD